MKETDNYNLKKPEKSDYIKVDDFNNNFDTIDEELKKAKDSASSVEDNKGEPGGYAELDSDGNVPEDQLGNANLDKEDIGLGKVKNEEQATKKEFDEHKAKKATDDSLGHVQVDDDTITVDSDGVISAAEMTAENVTIRDSDSNFNAGDVEGALSELFTNVSDGKKEIGDAITDADSDADIPDNPSFDDLKSVIINSFEDRKVWAKGEVELVEESDKKFVLEESGLNFEPKELIIYLTGSEKLGGSFDMFYGVFTSEQDFYYRTTETAEKYDNQVYGAIRLIHKNDTSSNGYVKYSTSGGILKRDGFKIVFNTGRVSEAEGRKFIYYAYG